MAQRKPAIRAIDGLLFEGRAPSERERESPSWRALIAGGYFAENSNSDIDFGPTCGAALGLSIERQSVSWAIVADPTGKRTVSGQERVPVAPIGPDGEPPPPRMAPEEFKHALTALLARAFEQAPPPVRTGEDGEAPAPVLAGVGVAWPDAITLKGEPTLDSHHPGFAKRDLRADIREVVEAAGFRSADDQPLSVQFINDADADLLFEARWGSVAGVRNVLGVKLCGGIGGAVLYEGQLMRGAHGRAGELNHTPVPVDWTQAGLDGTYANVLSLERLRPCDCGDENCIRRFVSGQAIIDTLGTYADPDYNVRGDMIQRAMGGPDGTRIADVFARAGTFLGQALIGPVRLLDPERVVITAFPRHENLSATVGTALTRSAKVGIRPADVVLGTPGSHVTPSGAARLVIEERILPLLERVEDVCRLKTPIHAYQLPSPLRRRVQPHDGDVSAFVHRYRPLELATSELRDAPDVPA